MIPGINFPFKLNLFFKMVTIILCTTGISLFSFSDVRAQEFEINEIAEGVFIVSGPELARQAVVRSQKGLVVFDTFWSETTARTVKNNLSEVLNRDDFSYVILTADRLDMLGGSAAYSEATIIGHENITKRYQDKDMEVEAELGDLIEMWRWKENAARERLADYEEGSEEAKNEAAWMNACKERADELASGFSLLLPAISYNDRMLVDLGDITLHLIWFGKEGNRTGLTVAVLPEKKVAVMPSFVLNTLHLAPNPFWDFKVMDVPRWISVLEEILEDEDAVEQVVCHDIAAVLSRERAHGHLVYIRKLWNSVKAAEAAGKDLPEIQETLSFDNEFAFVKEMDVYKETGDDWLKPQHRDHVRLFFLQLKDQLASQILKEGGPEELQASLARIEELRKSGSDIYFDEGSINQLGYDWMNRGKIPEAIEVFKLNVAVFPQSFNVYDSLGEGYMKQGDKQNAINNYRKSLEINPANENAAAMLKQLGEE